MMVWLVPYHKRKNDIGVSIKISEIVTLQGQAYVSCLMVYGSNGTIPYCLNIISEICKKL